MLTVKQQAVLKFIERYVNKHHLAPTEAEIAAGIGIKSRGVVHRYVSALVEAGYLQREPGRRRNLRLLHTSKRQLPILGNIAAGKPIESFAVPEQLALDDWFTDTDRFVLRVNGDSMLGDHICNGDYIICRRCREWVNGAIMVVLVDDSEVTLKRVQLNENGTVTLVASNPNMSPMVYLPERVTVQAIYLGLLRMEPAA